MLHNLHARKNKEDPKLRQQRLETLAARDPQAFERDKVKGAIRTDFILSAEIVAITPGIVADAPLLNQILILSGIAILVTVGVYGPVGVIVKLDDMGYWLAEKKSALAQWVGKVLTAIAPRLMKILTFVGTGDVSGWRRYRGSRRSAAASFHREFCPWAKRNAGIHIACGR